ncbi:SH3 domain-containing protein [Pseudomonas veronii]|uniref:SH3 domain-containing protein n=1 Tax=Pseudomonas veronii TaxID=76761 RepID=UPI0023DE7552|nr:SH3 domain-containing protein [Pseudomonas veronii]MDF3239615.1 SH3 domain-containing protein [Pseudomonas veronii]
MLEQRKVMFESGELQRELVKQLITPQALEAIAGFLASPAMKQLITFQQRFTSGVISYLQTPEVQAGLKAIEGFMASPQLHHAVRSAAELSAAMERFAGSPLAEYLLSGRGPDIGQLVDGAGVATVSVETTCDARVVSSDHLELEQQIIERLERGESPGALPKDHSQYLALVLMLIISFMGKCIEFQSAVRQELCFFQPKIAPMLTANQAGKAVRNFLCETDVPAELLQGYRLVNGVDVRLREGPGMKHRIISVSIPDRSVLEVLDSGNRDWLHVSVVGEDGVEGWISRKYTHRLIR